MFFDFALDGAAGEAELVGGEGAVAVVLAEAGFEDGTFDLLEGHVVGDGEFAGAGAGGAGEVDGGGGEYAVW